MNKLLTLTLLLLISTSINKIYGQSRNSIGIGAGINMPLQSGYRVGRDRVIQANLFSKYKWTFMPTLGWETILGSKNANNNPPLLSEPKRSADMAFLNLAAKYYGSKRVFGFAGPSYYIGGNRARSKGAGGTIGGGYDWPFDDYSSLEISLRVDVMPVYDKTVPVAGLRIAYKFNFSQLY